MSEVMLRLTGIEKTYNKGQESAVQVLQGVDLDLHAGEMVAMRFLFSVA